MSLAARPPNAPAVSARRVSPDAHAAWLRVLRNDDESPEAPDARVQPGMVVVPRGADAGMLCMSTVESGRCALLTGEDAAPARVVVVTDFGDVGMPEARQATLLAQALGIPVEVVCVDVRTPVPLSAAWSSPAPAEDAVLRRQREQLVKHVRRVVCRRGRCKVKQREAASVMEAVDAEGLRNDRRTLVVVGMQGARGFWDAPSGVDAAWVSAWPGPLLVVPMQNRSGMARSWSAMPA